MPDKKYNILHIPSGICLYKTSKFLRSFGYPKTAVVSDKELLRDRLEGFLFQNKKTTKIAFITNKDAHCNFLFVRNYFTLKSIEVSLNEFEIIEFDYQEY